MKKINLIFCLILSCLQIDINAQNTSETIKPFLNTIDQICKDFAQKQHLPSLVYGLVVDGKLVHSGNIGIINTTTKTNANNASVYRIASMTKSFAAVAILQLRDAGKLRLDDPAYQYIPELKGQKFSTDSPEITIRHLLTHAAGFPEDNPWGDRQLAISDEAMLKMFKKGISFSNTPITNFSINKIII